MMEIGNLTYVTEFTLAGLTSCRKIQIVLFMVFLIVYLFTILGNLVIILLVWTESSLHTPMYFFLIQLSGLEICYVTCTLPQMLVHLHSGTGAISFTRCATQMYFALSLGGTECLLLAAMAFDRYLAICQPLLYSTTMGKWRQLQLSLVCWSGGFILGSINVGSTLWFPFCGPNHVDHFFCELPAVLKLSCADTHIAEAAVFLASVLLLLFPVSIILTSYGLILCSVLQMRSISGRHKAFSTCASHLIVVTIFYGTVMSTYMIPRLESGPDHDKHISVFYMLITPLINPIIYTLRNKDVHGAVVKVMPPLFFCKKDSARSEHPITLTDWS
ncbi:olfactory receptor 2D2-like [Python bivittatus]|uniref:Olfactory receptor n=1 Tax=Python bivittatus TaxID=176946 RepID=A0A9F2RC05_PYTBI|nr:olfactory receptor 2D2-like [Python bivittatus]